MCNDLNLYCNFCLKILIIVVFSQLYLFNFLSGGIQLLRDLRVKERKEERESGLKDWNLTNSLGYFDVTLTWFLRLYVFGGDIERCNLKISLF